MATARQKWRDLPEGKTLPTLRPGDTVRVYIKIREGNKERLQAFEGVVIKLKRLGLHSTFTVRKVSYGIGVERIFPFFAPVVDRIERLSEGKVRRAKLYYLRKLSGRKARIETQEKSDAGTETAASAETGV